MAGGLPDLLGVVARGHLQFWSTANWEPTRAATNFIGIPDVGDEVGLTVADCVLENFLVPPK